MKTCIKIIKGYFNLLISLIGFISKSKKQLYKKRYEICKNCKYQDFNFCLICGCYIKAKTKVNFKLDENLKSIDGCPKKYW